jgi:hypothetical protein
MNRSPKRLYISEDSGQKFLMGLIFLSWLCLFIVFSGIGLLLPRSHLLPSFWSGYALSIVLLQVWHLFLPITSLAFVVLLALSLAGFLLQRRFLFRSFTYTIPNTMYTLVLLLPVALWTAHYALNNPPHYDDGLYHAQEMLWTEQSAIIPGLGNLHGRFAFNNAASLVMAAVDSVPLLAHPRYTINSLLLLVFIAQALWNGYKVIKDRDTSLYRLLYLLFLAPALYFTDSTNVNSLKNDLPVALLSIIVAAELLRLLQHPPEKPHAVVLHLTLLVSVSVAVKLSGAVLGAFLLLALLMLVLVRYRPMLLPLTGIVAGIVIAVIGVWLLRGVILSGYPLYPLAALSIPVEWKMDEQIVQAEADGVRSWARTPDADPETVLGNWNWLPGWWERNVRTRFVELVVPLGLASLSLLLTLAIVFKQRSLKPLLSRRWLFLLPIVPALVFWFFNAPDTRFGWHNLWLLGVGMFIISLQVLSANTMRNAALLTSAVLSAGVIAHALLTPDLEGEPIYPNTPAQNFYSYHGVRLNVPIYSPQCWDSELPCTPYPNYFVAQRPEGGYKLQTIESDKAAFSLVEIVGEQDIVPAQYIHQLRTGTLPTDGILVGRGWHSLESWDGGQHRWVDNNAEIYITACSGDHSQLEIEVEPGPSLNGEPFDLLLLDEHDRQVGKARVNGLQKVTFDLPLTSERVHVFRLYTRAKGEPAPNDGRMLNFRVTSINWG